MADHPFGNDTVIMPDLIDDEYTRDPEKHYFYRLNPLTEKPMRNIFDKKDHFETFFILEYKEL